MSASQIFVSIFAIVSLSVSVVAIWRIAKTPGLRYKPLWVFGSLFGFVGFATNMSSPGDLYLQLGIQVPPASIRMMLPVGDIILRAMFPLVAVAALAKCHSSANRPDA